MIEKLRRKFILILMGIVALILLAVFVSMLLSSWGNSKRMSENALRQALLMPPQSQEIIRPPGNGAPARPAMRMPVMLAEISPEGEVTLLDNQLYFVEEEAAKEIIQKVMELPEVSGVQRQYSLRWLKSDDGRRVAFADISREQEALKALAVNALVIGCAALAAFFVVSLLLARWAVRPVELAWERQRQFVADASHELKTPLTVILSNADMLSGAGTFGDEKQARRMEHIRAEALRMKKLTEDLLTLARSDQTEVDSAPEQVDFSYVVKSAALTFDPVAFHEKKNLTCQAPDKLFVRGDAERLRQLLSILLDNALKYCPPGGRIELSLKAEENRTALLLVRNEGEPIPREELAHIFRRFYRLDPSRSAHGSFGLGLSIAENIVRDHKGKIWAASDVKTGNSFYVSLPLEKRQEF